MPNGMNEIVIGNAESLYQSSTIKYPLKSVLLDSLHPSRTKHAPSDCVMMRINISGEEQVSESQENERRDNEQEESETPAGFRGVTQEEMRATYIVPTVAINRFVVSTNPVSIRIAFGETLYPEDQVNWRIALSLTHFEAIELKDVLASLLAPFEAHYSQGTSNDGPASE